MLNGDRVQRENLARIGELRRRLELAVGVDDLGSALALGFGLLGHGALHVLGQVDLLDLDGRHLYPPGLGVLVDDPLELLVDLVARRQEVVQLDLTEHAPQRRLGDLRGRVEIVLDRDHRSLRIDHSEVDDGADLQRHVVARDHVLRRQVERDGLEAPLHHLVDEGHQQDEPRPVAVPARVQDRLGAAAQAKDDRSLVLAQDAREGADEEERHEDGDDEQQRVHRDHATPPLGSAFVTFSVSPSTPTIRTWPPSSTGSPSAIARQISPETNTWPSGASRSRTLAVLPMSPSAPVAGGCPSARTPTATTNKKNPAVAPTVGAITHQDTRKPTSGESKSISEPSAIEMMPPIARTPWLTILISATSNTIPNRIRSSPA